MADEKVYTPEVIAENPLPSQDTVVPYDASQATNPSNGVYNPATTQDQLLTSKRIATELISSNINTKTQKILGAFQFTPSGAIQIGDYEEGETGDVRISPEGIAGRNKQGQNTFVLDAETGDASFLGTLLAGTIVGGDNKVIIENPGGGGRIIIYDDNNVPRILIGFQQGGF